jgi:hypothetical protein
MVLPVQQFPILTPGQMNPFHQALSAGMENYEKTVKNAYLADQLKAKIASQSTYANLMGPQYIASLLKNPDVVASMKHPEKDLETVENAGMAATVGATGQQGNTQGGGSSLLSNLGDWMHRKIFGDQQAAQQQQAQQVQQQNAQQQAPTGKPVGPTMRAGSEGTATDAWVEQKSREAAASTAGYDDNNPTGNQQQQTAVAPPAGPANNEQELNAQINAPYDKTGMDYAVDTSSKEAGYGPKKKTWAEKAGENAGVIEEGKKMGDIRATAVDDLSKQYTSLVGLRDTYDSLQKILTSPVLEHIKQLPITGRHEIGWYSKNGTAEERNMATKLISSSRSLVSAAAPLFKGQFTNKDLQLLLETKVDEGDSIDGMKGKYESGKALVELNMKRALKSQELITNYHMNPAKAYQIADRMYKGDTIRAQVHNEVYPSVKVSRMVNGKKESKTVSRAEARRMGVSNV